MAFRKVSYLIPSCDGCGLAWSFFDLACADGIPPHFADRGAALEQLPRDYGWQVRSFPFGRPLMACRTCAAAGIIPAGPFRGWLLATAGWVRRVVPFGPVRSPLPPRPGRRHPESLTAELPPEDEELLAAIENENFRNREGEPSVSLAPTAFWVDRDHDREYASDGISRYGAYLRDATFEPWTDDDQAVEWAVFAWRRATGPVMSPGYVRYHPRVLAARLERSGWDGGLVAGVDLVSSWPEQLKTALAPGLRLGDRNAYWQDWPTECRGDAISYYEPSEADVAARPYLLATLSLQFTVPSATLPKPPASSAALLSAGQQAVAVVMAELNRIVGPVLSAGLGGTPPAVGRGW